jgi:CrcB protein
MRNLLLVMLAGGLGSGVRYVVATHLNPPGGIPWGTLTVNVVGAFLIGLVVALAVEARVVSREVALVLTTGFLGGLTTFSSFALEGESMLQRRDWWMAGGYVVGSVALGVGMAWCGYRTARCFG